MTLSSSPPCEGKVLHVSPLATDLVMQLQRRQDNCQWMFWQSAKPTARRAVGEGEKCTVGKQSYEQALMQDATMEQQKAFLSYILLEEREEFPLHD